MNQQLKELVDREKPHIFYHSIFDDELDKELADYIAYHTATTSLVFFSDDDWRLAHSLQWVEHYNFALTTCEGAAAEYQRRGHHNVILTQYACNPDLYYPLQRDKKYDVTFVGQAYKGRPEALIYLKNHGINLHVWGSGWEKFPELREIARGYLPHHEMLEVFAASKIVLGLSWCSIDGSTPQIKGRIFEYAACKAFQLATFDPRLRAFFEEGEELVFYHDLPDLLDKIRHYLARDADRERVAEAAYQRALSQHTWDHRYGDIFRQMRERQPAGKLDITSPDKLSAVPNHSLVFPTRPRVSVVCFVYNGEEYIADLIVSVLGQSFRDFEFLILDDGSTDGTSDIVKGFLSDPRLRYVYQENIGKDYNTFDRLNNICISLAKGDYICFIGADDICLPHKLARQLKEFEENPDIDIIFSDGYHIDKNGRILTSDFHFNESISFNKKNLLRTLFSKNIIPHPTVMIKREALELMGGFETGFCPDYQFWLKSAPYLNFKYVDEKLIKYRIHDRGASTGKGNKTTPETIKVLGMMRDRFTIRDLYPEIDACKEKQSALYSAYLDFGNTLLMANIPVPYLAVQEYRRALEHNPHGLEALNNVGVALWMMGEYDKSRQVFEHLSQVGRASAVIGKNATLAARLGRGQAPRSADLVLLSETPVRSELLRQIGSSKNTERSTENIDQATQPKVSIIITTYNRPNTLIEAMQSVLKQTYENIEIIVVNDGGMDVENIINFMNDKKNIVYVRHEKNRGVSSARNTGIRLASGEYLAYLDDDDIYYENHVKTLVEFLENHEEKMAYTNAYRVCQVRGEGGKYTVSQRDMPWNEDFDYDKILVGNFIPVLCIMHHRECLDEVGLFDEDLTTHEDWDLWIRISRKFRIAHLRQVTCEYTWRTDGTSTTSAKRDDFIRTLEIIYGKYAAYVKDRPDLKKAQQRYLKNLQATVSDKRRSFSAVPERQRLDVSIIIPVFNKVELTQQCLIHLARVTHDLTYEVIVIDNASTDGTSEFLEALDGDVHIIRNLENQGFARACNQGARAARGRFLVFLNNDTIPLEGWLQALVEEVEAHPDVAVVGSKLLYPNGTVQHAGVVFSRTFGTPYHLYHSFPADAPVVNRRREFQVVTAACMLVRREVFAAVGGFDEGYRNGFEDVDLCLKIRERGGRVVYQPKSVLYHLESQTPGRKDHDAANSRRLLERWEGRWLTDEDTVYVPDGYAIRTIYEDGCPSYRLTALTDREENARWERVAEVERQGQAGNVAAVRSLLAQPDLWPLDLGVLRWAAQLCSRAGVPAYAEAFWRRALTLSATPDVLVALTRIALEKGTLDEAERHLCELISAIPTHGEGWLLRGILAMQRRDFVMATAAFANALHHGDNTRKARKGLGMAAIGLGQMETAWEMFAAVLADDIDDAEAIHCLLRAGTALERWQPLVEYLSSYLKLNPGDLSVRFALAGVQIRQGDWGAAREHYDLIRLLEPTFVGLDDLAQMLERQMPGVSA